MKTIYNILSTIILLVGLGVGFTFGISFPEEQPDYKLNFLSSAFGTVIQIETKSGNKVHVSVDETVIDEALVLVLME